jgi:hypothetical protein
VVLRVPQLGGDEQLRPRHARGADALPNLRLIAVSPRAVEVPGVRRPQGAAPVSQAEGALHRHGHLARGGPPGTQPQQGHPLGDGAGAGAGAGDGAGAVIRHFRLILCDA